MHGRSQARMAEHGRVWPVTARQSISRISVIFANLLEHTKSLLVPRFQIRSLKMDYVCGIRLKTIVLVLTNNIVPLSISTMHWHKG